MISDRQRLMLDKLIEQAQRGFIDSLWSEDFIDDMRIRVAKGYPLTEKQANKLEELFERY